MILLSNDTTYPIFTNYLKFDTTSMSLSPNPVLLYALRFGPAVAAFLLISALAHFSLATFGYKWYVRNLEKGMNPARFYEYALSSSLMIVLIGMLVGVWDLGAMILMFGLNAMMNLFGIMMELHNQTSSQDQLDFVHLWKHCGYFPLDRDCHVFPGITWFIGCKAAGFRLCDHTHHLCVL